jgi:hypothetical protein
MVRDATHAIENNRNGNGGPTFGLADSDIYLTLSNGGYLGHTNFGNSYNLPA